MPMSIGLRIPEEFEHFVHEDEVLGRERWSIDLGRSNAALFTQLFGYMFDDVTILGPDDDATTLDIDALIEPSIDAFEFSVPSQSRTDAYAVWIRYRLRIYDSAGTQHANWPLAAYGKSEQTGLTGGEPLKRAAVLAMRDAAALMIMKLDKATGLSALKDRQATTVAGPPLPICVTFAGLTLSGCITSRVEDAREGVTGIEDGESIVILAKSYHLGNETEDKYIRCIEDALSRGSKGLRVIPHKQFVDSLFPWFEPRTAPA
jgi:hypothetical protein